MHTLNSLKAIAMATALSAAALIGSAATASTVSLTTGGDATGSGSPTGSFSSGGISGSIAAGCGYTGFDVNCTGGGGAFTTPTITIGTAGMGVASVNDTNNQLDATNNDEFLTFTFTSAVNLFGIDFSLFGIGDSYDLLINGTLYASSQTTDPWATEIDNVTSFTIASTGTGTFRIGSFDVEASSGASTVPLPATGLLLMGALGGLGLSRRRRKA